MNRCQYRNIFIHHMFGGIGDFIMGTSAINMIKSVYPEVKITVLAPFPATDIVKNNPAVDNIITLKYKSGSVSLAKEIRLIQQLRGAKYDLSLSFDCKDRFALATFLASIPTRVGQTRLITKNLTGHWQANCKRMKLKSLMTLQLSTKPKYINTWFRHFWGLNRNITSR